MYPYQKALVNRLLRMERDGRVHIGTDVMVESRIGFITDPPGWGKTWMVASLIAETKDTEIPPHVTTVCKTCVEGLVNVTTRKNLAEEKQYNRSTLLLCSQTAIPTWIKAFNVFGLSFTLYDGGSLRIADVVLVTPSTFNKIAEQYYWKRFVFDDPHMNKVSYMSNVDAVFHWLVSSRPFDTEGLWSTSRYLGEYMPKILHLVSEPVIQEALSFSSPDNSLPEIRTINQVHKGFSKTYSAFSPFVTHDGMNELLTSCDINGIISRYGGGKTNDLASVIDAQYQREISELRERNNPEMLAFKLRRYEELRRTIQEYQRQICPICRDELRVENTVMEPGCNALFCVPCLTHSLKSRGSCPVCRCQISRGNLIYVTNDTTPVEKLPSKDDLVLSIVRAHPEKRILVYSSGGLHSLRNMLEKNNIPYRELRGALSTIQRGLTSNAKVFLTEVIHSGLFIERISDLVLYNSMRKEKVYKSILSMCRSPFTEETTLRVHQLLFDRENPGIIKNSTVERNEMSE